VSLTEFGFVTVFSTKVSAIVAFVLFLPLLTASAYSLQHLHEPGSHFQEFSIAALSCKALCDVLITVGMVYTLLRNRTQFRRTNNVLNILAIYAINCGTLSLAFAISCVALLAKYQDTLIYTPSLFIMIRLYVCAFISILNSRDNLRETLEGPEGVVVATLTQLNAPAGASPPCDTQDTTDPSTKMAAPKSLPPVSIFSDTSFSDSVMAFDREKYPVAPVFEVFDGMSG
jgi:hypothetical protein